MARMISLDSGLAARDFWTGELSGALRAVAAEYDEQLQEARGRMSTASDTPPQPSSLPDFEGARDKFEQAKLNLRRRQESARQLTDRVRRFLFLFLKLHY